MPMFINNPIFSLIKTPINTKRTTCRKHNSFLPNVNPSIFSLSNNISAPGVYSFIYMKLNDMNFLIFNLLKPCFGAMLSLQLIHLYTINNEPTN